MRNAYLRQLLQQRRAALSPAERQEQTHIITERLLTSDIFHNSQHIAVYIALPNEVGTTAIIKTIWQHQKQCYVPRMTPPNQLDFLLYEHQDELTPNKWGILEPKKTQVHDAQTLDLALLPMVGYTDNHYRLGMGAGYYDRTFAFLNTTPRPSRPILIGLAFACQYTDQFKPQAWDVQLDQVITSE